MPARYEALDSLNDKPTCTVALGLVAMVAVEFESQMHDCLEAQII
jgi:hypothetical protein